MGSEKSVYLNSKETVVQPHSVSFVETVLGTRTWILMAIGQCVLSLEGVSL